MLYPKDFICAKQFFSEERAAVLCLGACLQTVGMRTWGYEGLLMLASRKNSEPKDIDAKGIRQDDKGFLSESDGFC